MNSLFYCYSNRLNKFLRLFGEYYIDKRINSKNQQYYIYNSSDKLTMLINEWNRIKEKIDIKDIK